MDRKEAMEIVRKNWPDSSRTMLREALETLIPELKESEKDEKIRNELLLIIRRYIGYIEEESCEPHLKDFFIKEAEEVIDWLEEQVKQKSEWSTVDRDTPNWIGNK